MSAFNTNQEEFDRLRRDLAVVMEKVKMCREMLLVSKGINEDEILADVIGFLEACRDRMSDLIEAGTQGLLGEELFADVLKVNDSVLKILDAERVGELLIVMFMSSNFDLQTGTRIDVEDDSSQKVVEKKESVNLLDF